MENTNQQNNSRGKADFPPSLWGCSFASFSFPQTVYYFSSVCIASSVAFLLMILSIKTTKKNYQ
jgi:hypothetical protein